MLIDWTLRLGDIVTAVIIGGGGVFALGVMRTEVQGQHAKLTKIETEIAKQTDILVELGRQDERLKSQDASIRALISRIDQMVARAA